MAHGLTAEMFLGGALVAEAYLKLISFSSQKAAAMDNDISHINSKFKNGIPETEPLM